MTGLPKEVLVKLTIMGSKMPIKAHGIHFYDEINDELIKDKHDKIIVLSSLKENEELNHKINSLDWDVIKIIPYNKLGVKLYYDQYLIEQAASSMSKRQFEREFLCKI
jgi:hypothetical protein